MTPSRQRKGYTGPSPHTVSSQLGQGLLFIKKIHTIFCQMALQLSKDTGVLFITWPWWVIIPDCIHHIGSWAVALKTLGGRQWWPANLTQRHHIWLSNDLSNFSIEWLYLIKFSVTSIDVWQYEGNYIQHSKSIVTIVLFNLKLFSSNSSLYNISLSEQVSNPQPVFFTQCDKRRRRRRRGRRRRSTVNDILY